MIYENGQFCIVSDFNMKEIKKDRYNIDILIHLEGRCINVYLDNSPKCLNSRLQFPLVTSVLIRFCILEDNNIGTIHFLSGSDLYSTIANFEIDYNDHFIQLKNREYFAEMKISSK
ncbi:hypothetical protein OW763_12200 [Clostridium aestuarii]|uniref:Uncharacterized protein n=1 Tax=Clostridium aestuarii TaxID=338193 RepID=A0ABT4D1H8_9CLOT|nr:hypothetical protein [Clostridium aestuarii]MCY6485101.1 hypothetical protein [Clostridium aestuarii]